MLHSDRTLRSDAHPPATTGTHRQDGCPISWLSNDCLFYILNMCRHDWVTDESAQEGVAGNALGKGAATQDKDNDGWEPEWWE